MGGSQRPFLLSLDFLSKGNCNDISNNPLWSKVLEYQAKKRLRVASTKSKRPRNGRVVMKKRARLERRRRPVNEIERKVRTLKKLIPNCDSMGLDTLFRETTDYILALQLRVKVMQIMVNVLSGSDGE